MECTILQRTLDLRRQVIKDIRCIEYDGYFNTIRTFQDKSTIEILKRLSLTLNLHNKKRSTMFIEKRHSMHFIPHLKLVETTYRETKLPGIRT